MIRPFFSIFSPSGAKAKLSVLIFHRVLPSPDPLFPSEMTAKQFDLVCGWMKSWFNVLPLDQAVEKLRNGNLPSRAACITFDDGYADNLTVAVPILKQHGLTATFFIATGYLDGGRMWNDTISEAIRHTSAPTLDISNAGRGAYPLVTLEQKRMAIVRIIDQVKYLPVRERSEVANDVAVRLHTRLPSDLMMTSAQVKALRNEGMQIGAHTQTHPILAKLDEAMARSEIGQSKQILENLLGERVGLFAYPNGKPGKDYSPESVDIVKQLGFVAAVSTAWGTNSQGDDLFQMRRFTPWDTTKNKFGLRLLRNMAFSS